MHQRHRQFLQTPAETYRAALRPSIFEILKFRRTHYLPTPHVDMRPSRVLQTLFPLQDRLAADRAFFPAVLAVAYGVIQSSSRRPGMF